MADKGDKPDWGSLAREFLLLQESKGMKIKEFAALRGLNENSARRGINQAAKLIREEKPDQINSDQKVKKASKKEINKSEVITKKRGRPRNGDANGEAAPAASSGENDAGEGDSDGLAHASQGAPKRDQKGAGSPPQRGKNRDQKTDHKKSEKPTLKVITGEVIPLKKNKGGAKPGNENALTTGRKRKIKNEDVEAAMADMKAFDLPDKWQDTIQTKLIEDLMAHYHLTVRARDKSMLRLLREEMEAAEEEAHPSPRDPDEPRVVQMTPPEFKMLKMLSDTGYTLTDILRTTSQILAHISKEERDNLAARIKKETHDAKLRQQEEAHQLKLYGKMKGSLIAQAFLIMEDGEENPARRAAQLLETNGVELPSTIKRLLELELAREKDKIDETGGMTPEEIDAYVAEAEGKRTGHHEWLAQKRQIVAAIVDEHGYGDIDADGVRRSDEIQAIFQPGEEIDLDATGDLYGDAEPSPHVPVDELDVDVVPEEEDAALWAGEGNFTEEEDEEDVDETIEHFMENDD